MSSLLPPILPAAPAGIPRRRLLAGGAALAAASLVPLASATAASPHAADLFNGRQIAWHDVPSGLAAARRQGRPAYMLQHATWCGVCRVFRAVFQDPRVVAMSRRLVFILADVDQDVAALAPYGWLGNYVPLSVILSASGRPATTIQGPDPMTPFYVDPDDPAGLLAFLAAGLAEAG